MGSGGTSPLIPKLDMSWGRVVGFGSRGTLRRPLARMSGGPQSRSGRFVEQVQCIAADRNRAAIHSAVHTSAWSLHTLSHIGPQYYLYLSVTNKLTDWKTRHSTVHPGASALLWSRPVQNLLCCSCLWRSVVCSESSRLVPYREIIAVCSQIHSKHINILCGQNVELYIKIQSVPRSKHSPSQL